MLRAQTEPFWDVSVQNLCFTKKIRYESRKQLAQARPRVKGQFVRMPSGAETPETTGLGAPMEADEPVAAVASIATGMQLVAAAAEVAEAAAAAGAAPLADGEEVRSPTLHASFAGLITCSPGYNGREPCTCLMTSDGRARTPSA